MVPEGLEPIVSPSDKGDVEAESGLVNGTREDSTREGGTGDREENMEVSGDSKEQKQEGSTEEGDAEEKGEVDEGTEHVEEEKQEDVEEQKDEGGTGGDEVDSKAEEETEGAPSDEREEEKADDDEMKADDEATEELSGEKEDMVDVEEEKEEWSYYIIKAEEKRIFRNAPALVYIFMQFSIVCRVQCGGTAEVGCLFCLFEMEYNGNVCTGKTTAISLEPILY